MQYRLGTMLDKGEGGPKDLAEAHRLYGLAAAQGMLRRSKHWRRSPTQWPRPCWPKRRQRRLRNPRPRRARASVKRAPYTLPPQPPQLDHPTTSTSDGSGMTTAGGASGTAEHAVTVADDALRGAIADGTYEALSAVLETHRTAASDQVVAEARTA